MKFLLLGIVLFFQTSVWAGETQTVHIKVAGFACPLCALRAEKLLGEITGILQAKVDYDRQLAKIEMQADLEPNLQKIRQVLLNAGFNPGEKFEPQSQ